MRRTPLLVILCGTLTMAGTLAACRPQWPPHGPPPQHETTTSSTVPGTTPATSLPGTGQTDCGTAYLASGWPTTTAPNPASTQCILDAFDQGTPAIYRERAQTDGQGGHIQITTYEVIGVKQVRRTVDATGAQPPGGVTVSVCTGLSGFGTLTAAGCTPA